MTSKEYIKAKLEYLIRYEPSLSFDIDMFEQVLKDLDSLEVLKKENKELKETIEIRKQMNINLIDFGTKLKQENERLKKAIEILKRRVISLKGIKDCESATEYNRYTSLGLITQQEYELLKEVLGE